MSGKANGSITYSIIIPVYNSERSLRELHERLTKVMKEIKKNYEIIFVDDASDDSSWECLKKISKNDQNIKIYQLSKNFGQTNTIMCGLNVSQGQFCITMDDDLQHDPIEIIKLINGINETDNDVIYGNFKGKKQSIMKNLASWFNGKIAKILLKTKNDIYLSPFRIIKRQIVDETIKYKGPFPDIDGLILRTTDYYDQVEVAHSIRKYGSSNYTLKKMFLLWLNTFTNFSVVPLRIAAISGGIFTLFAIAIVIYYFVRKVIDPNYLLQGWLSTIVFVVFIGGFVLLSLGIIGEYIGRIFILLNQAPQYIIHKRNKKQ